MLKLIRGQKIEIYKYKQQGEMISSLSKIFSVCKPNVNTCFFFLRYMDMIFYEIVKNYVYLNKIKSRNDRKSGISKLFHKFCLFGIWIGLQNMSKMGIMS